MKTEFARPSSAESYSSFSLPSPREITTPNSRVPHHYNSGGSSTTMENLSNLSSYSGSLTNMYNRSFKSDAQQSSRHSVSCLSPASQNSSLVTTPPLSSSPISPNSEPLRNITNNPNLLHCQSSSTTTTLNYNNTTNNNLPEYGNNNLSRLSSVNSSTSAQNNSQLPLNTSIKASPSKTSHITSLPPQNIKSTDKSTALCETPSKNTQEGSTSSAGSTATTSSSSSTSPSKSLGFRKEQVDCICDVLIQAREMDKLSKFLNTLPASYLTNDGASEIILKAKAEVAFAKGSYKEVYNLLQSYNFHSDYHKHLQDMWHAAHYKEAEMVRQRALGKSITC